MFSFALNILFCYFMADFTSGLFHWIEDAYLDSTKLKNIPFFHHIALQNEIHHRSPAAFLDCHPLENIATTVPFYAVIGTILLMIHPSFWILLWLNMSLFANMIHRWSHDPERPHQIEVLQNLGIIQTPDHHRRHHSFGDGPSTHYCVISNYLNPLLDRIGFWKRLEDVLRDYAGIQTNQRPAITP